MVFLPPGFSYAPDWMAPGEADALLAGLLAETPWEDHVFSIFGRTVPMPRRIALYGPIGYAYSGVVHPPRAMTPRLDAVRARVEEATGLPFNTVLVNLYRDGQDSMGPHSDDDYAHGGQPAVASVSVGAARSFVLLRKEGKERVRLDLTHGSLLLMSGESQRAWRHAVPKTSREVGVRVNMTFRHMV